MSALSDHQARQRAQRIATAKERLSIARRYLSTRPQATGSDVIRNLVEVAVGLIEELSITGDTKA
jgi:hypothetical protein